jgi:two-component system response regulator AtoC
VRLLLAEDDRIVRITVRDALDEAGYRVEACADGTAALQALEREPFDLVLTDVRLPGVDGLQLFREARRLLPDAGVVLMTAFAHAEDAVAVMREGARDYVQKPFEMDELLARIGRVRDEVAFRSGMRQGRPGAPPGTILGDAAPVRLLLDRLDAAAAADVPVLISGETGTGKDLCARTIHQRSRRAGRPFVVVSCAALPEALFEAELFGHEKGAFTGAVQRRIGRFEAADGGTLFLDEVGELTLASQAKLLRAIETSTFEPLGSNRSQRVDVRVVAATNRDLAAELERGAFRRDLYYRLNVIDLRTPALREHRSDLPLLTAHFLQEIATRMGRSLPELEPAAVAALAAHTWPGNVRELLHALERAVALARTGPIRLDHLPPDLAASSPAGQPGAVGVPPGRGQAPDGAVRPLGEAVDQFERQYIQRVLDQTGGHRSRAAALLGISRKSLWERLREVSRADRGGGDGEGDGST